MKKQIYIQTPYEKIQELREQQKQLILLCQKKLPVMITEPIFQKKNAFIKDIVEEIDNKMTDNDVQEKLEQFQKMSHQEKLNYIDDNSDLITTDSYIQRVIASKNQKKEAINVSLLHMEIRFPSVKEQNLALQECNLKSFKFKQKQDSKEKYIRLHNLNVLKPLSERYDILKAPDFDPLEPLIHVSIYHPFKSKRTQEIILLGCQPLRDLLNIIRCTVEMTEKQYFTDEIENFNPPQIDKLYNLDEKIGNQPIELCKFYHYVHLNQCIHRIAFHEVRELSQDDPKELKNYREGVIVFEGPPSKRICTGCGKEAQIYRVGDSKISNEIFLFLCNDCDSLIHKDQNDQQKYEAPQPYPYYMH